MENYIMISQNGCIVLQILQYMVNKLLSKLERDKSFKSKILGLLQLQPFVTQGSRLRKFGNMVIKGVGLLSEL